jgi:hypothetical protein
VFIATLNSIPVISLRSVLFEEETGVPGENHRPVAINWQALSHNGVSSFIYFNATEKYFKLNQLIK